MQILLILAVLWFLASQVGKVTSSLNNASRAVAPLGQTAGALTGVINAGAAAIGRFGGGGGGTPASGYGTMNSSLPGYSVAADPSNVHSTTSGIDPSTGGAYLAPGDSYGPPAPSSAMSDDLLAPDYADV